MSFQHKEGRTIFQMTCSAMFICKHFNPLRKVGLNVLATLVYERTIG